MKFPLSLHTPHTPRSPLLAASLASTLLLGPALAGLAGPATAWAAPGGASAPAPVQIQLTADEFSFSPGTIVLPLGQTVQLTVTNKGQLDHDIKSDIPVSQLTYIKADNDPDEQKDNAANGTFDVDYNKGDTAQVTFVPTQPGAYEFHCDVTGHMAAGMEGMFIVLPANATTVYQANQGQLLLRSASGQIYALYGAQLLPVPDLATFTAKSYDWNDVVDVPDSVIGGFQLGSSGLLPATTSATALHSGDVVRTSTGKIYVLDGGARHWIPDLATFSKLGYAWTQVRVVFDNALANFTDDGPAK